MLRSRSKGANPDPDAAEVSPEMANGMARFRLHNYQGCIESRLKCQRALTLPEAMEVFLIETNDYLRECSRTESDIQQYHSREQDQDSSIKAEAIKENLSIRLEIAQERGHLVAALAHDIGKRLLEASRSDAAEAANLIGSSATDFTDSIGLDRKWHAQRVHEIWHGARAKLVTVKDDLLIGAFFNTSESTMKKSHNRQPERGCVPRIPFENYGMALVTRDGQDPRVMYYLTDTEIETLQAIIPEWKKAAPKLPLLHDWLVGTANLSPETIDTATMPYLLSVIRAHFKSATEPEIPTERKVGAHRKDPSKPFAGKSCGDLEMRMTASKFEVRIIGNSGALRSFAIEEFGLKVGQQKTKLLFEIFVQSDSGETTFDGVTKPTISKLNARFTEIWGVTDLLLVIAGRKIKATAGRIMRT